MKTFEKFVNFLTFSENLGQNAVFAGFSRGLAACPLLPYARTADKPTPNSQLYKISDCRKRKFSIHFHRRTCADDENTAREKNRVRVAIRHENAIFCDRVNPKEGCRSVAQPHCDEPLLCACRVSRHAIKFFFPLASLPFPCYNHRNGKGAV